MLLVIREQLHLLVNAALLVLLTYRLAPHITRQLASPISSPLASRTQGTQLPVDIAIIIAIIIAFVLVAMDICPIIIISVITIDK